ncbi:MAG TPA: flagellar basal body-associated FliL family protein [Baekduia sp.]|uniref:flagellar basal body-associated FliL family protein n=1 Tax=Baekduia sp. TaxID=2600305 RepID=UPI002CEEA444|nr:flagellar basal body-associated FliL family protein [Baekduia sp.]HMJ33118.1 flagellar basal body-associated FliL family protein [Baekduia sp.]
MAKLKFVLPVLLVVLGGVYKFVLAKPAPVHKPKIAGEVYILQKDFLINLKGGRFAKLNAALVLKEGYAVAGAAGHGAAPAAPPDGYGAMPQEAVVRSIVTDTLTDATAEKLQREKSRQKIQKAILKRITTETDVEAENVLFTDVAIQ